MDIQAYISSGVIESYIIGVATPQEAELLLLYCKQYPEIKAALDELTQLIENYVAVNAVAPPTALKQNIWNQINAGTKDINTPKALLKSFPPSNAITINRWKYIAAAAIILFLISLSINILFNRNLGIYKEQIASLQLQQQQLFTQNNTFKLKLAAYDSDIAIMVNANYKPIALQATPNHLGMAATVFWSNASHDVYLALNNLPPAPVGKQYQLWAIVDGKPVDMGVCSATDGKLQKMKEVIAPNMFAITLENEGGSPVPTLNQMYVAGKI